MREFFIVAVVFVLHVVAMIVPWVSVNIVYPEVEYVAVNALSQPLIRVGGSVVPVPSLPGFAPLMFSLALAASVAAMVLKATVRGRVAASSIAAILAIILWYFTLSTAVKNAYYALTSYALGGTLVFYEQTSTPMILLAIANLLILFDNILPLLSTLIKRREHVQTT